MRTLKRWLTPPVLEDENKTHQALMLHVIVWALICVPVPYVLYTIIQTPENIERAIAQAAFGEAANALLLYLLRRGQVRLASIIQVITFWAFFTATAVTGAGVRGPAYLLGYSLVIIIAGVLLGGRGAMAVTGVATVTGGVMVYAENQGWLVPDVSDTALTTWIVSLVLFPVSATLQNLAARTVRQALARARVSEARTRALLEAVPDLIFELDRAGRFLYFSPTPEVRPYVLPEQFIGKPVGEVMPPHVATLALEAISRALDTGQVQQIEYQLPAGEQMRDYEARLVASGADRVTSIVRDITERKQAEVERERLIAELEAKNTELERFTYTVSHDLKSPLVTIRGFLGLVEKDALAGDEGQLKADMNRIIDATDKMHRLLSELLELSRIGRMMNPSQAVPFEAIAHEALDLVRGCTQARGAQVDIAPGLPTVYGDRARLVEVVQNLVDNACKFMGEQPAPRIEIGQRGLDADGKSILFVRDNGVGIEPQYHDKVFGLFNKLDAHSEGTGVGLSLVRRIIEVHGGRIWVESEGNGQGATFCFTLPTLHHPPQESKHEG